MKLSHGVEMTKKVVEKTKRVLKMTLGAREVAEGTIEMKERRMKKTEGLFPLFPVKPEDQVNIMRLSAAAYYKMLTKVA
jgi:hypothetical protein